MQTKQRLFAQVKLVSQALSCTSIKVSSGLDFEIVYSVWTVKHKFVNNDCGLTAKSADGAMFICTTEISFSGTLRLYLGADVHGKRTGGELV